MFVVVAVDAADASLAAAQLRAHGSTTIEERSVSPGRVLLRAGAFDDAAALAVVATLRAQGWPADVRPAGGGHLRAWQAHTAPIVITPRLWVCFPWSEFDRREAQDVVEIDPGRAFGTGGHPSTRLLLVALAGRLRGGETVLDAGCGSGVLAVTAARLGAAAVTAVDVNPGALTATKANAVRNGVGGRVEVAGTLVESLTGVYDIVVANMDAATLIRLGPALQGLVAPDGWLGLSGLSPAQLSVAAAAYPQMRIVASPRADDWAALIAAPTAIRVAAPDRPDAARQRPAADRLGADLGTPRPQQPCPATDRSSGPPRRLRQNAPRRPC